MLRPPRSLEELNHTARSIESGIRPAEPPKSKMFAQSVQGMGYIHQPEEVKSGKKNTTIPIMTVPPHVLMTSECSYLTGYGEKIKGDNQRLS
jgi:hypothetical protein